MAFMALDNRNIKINIFLTKALVMNVRNSSIGGSIVAPYTTRNTKFLWTNQKISSFFISLLFSYPFSPADKIDTCTNSTGPDGMARIGPSHLDIHCLPFWF